ncbi:dual specificity protein phosphatase 10 isoform X2 [Conger conger]|nr:dual specificity protein phosphatase 10 isoform X2 [Conger conger]
MPPSPLDDRIVVALRPIRPQDLKLRLDRPGSGCLDSVSPGDGPLVSATVLEIGAATLSYMPSSSGSSRSLSCGCSSVSCCSVSTYAKDPAPPSAAPRVSLSSPNLSSALPPAAPSAEHEALTPPVTPPAPRPPAPRPPSPVRLIHPAELARRMTRPAKPGPAPAPPAAAPPVIIDCRPFMEYNRCHIRGAVHVSCSDKISRRRLQQGKVTVLDLLSGRQGPDSFAGLFSRDIVVYDDGTADPGRATPTQPLQVVLESLHREGKDPIVLKGGLSSFRLNHEGLCDNSLHLQEGLDVGGAAGLSGAGGVALSLPSTPDVENAELTPILPLLFLGNERDAQDLELLQRLNIGFVLNVTTHLPLFHYDCGLLSYKRLPATDSNKQNLRQYFEEAFEFIEEAHRAGQGLLIHCQAGVSRSATIVIAYLMKHTWMTMTDAYKFVKTRRPIISPNLNFMGQLLEFEEDLNNGITPRILIPKLMGVETIV